MSLSSIIRSSARRIVGVGCRRNYLFCGLYASASQSDTLYPVRPCLVANPRRDFSTAVDTKKPTSTESLLKVIESEIQVAQESDHHEPVPEGYPFKIDDNDGKHTIILTREYEGETVKVEVYMPDLITGYDNDDDEEKEGDDDDTERPIESNIPLLVTISKKSGTNLKFSCVAYADRIKIESLSVGNPETPEDMAYLGPNFNDLDVKLRKAFHNYLEMRGIKPSSTNFLHEYMLNKDGREYLGWLKNLKTFIEA